jgi:opine dehydrogenase
VAGRRVLCVGTHPEALLLGACLTLAGHEVVLLETRPPRVAAPPGAAAHTLRLLTSSGEHEVRLGSVTSDPFEALGACGVVLICTPPHALQAVMTLVLPLAEPRHTIVLLPGGLSSLACATWLRDRGRVDLPALVASDAAPFSGRTLADGRMEVLAATVMPGFGVHPAGRADDVWPVIADLFPGAHLFAHVLAAALASPLSFVRAPALLLRAAVPAAGETPFAGGFTREVARLAASLDAERLALGAALGLELAAAPHTLNRWGVAPLGDLWATVHGSFVLTSAGVGDAAHEDQLADDVRYGLRPLADLAAELGVPLPLTRALVTLCTALDGRGDDGWSLSDLGLAGATAGRLAGYLHDGVVDADA